MASKKSSSQRVSLRLQDPYLAREQEKYVFPLPSREWIIQILEDIGVPQSVEQLSEKLSIKPAETEFFGHRLRAMMRDGQILINRRGLICVADKLDIIKCRVERHKDGFGFAIPLNPNAGENLVLYERQLYNVMHGDIVTVRPKGLDRRGRREGQVLDIIERAHNQVVGRFHMEYGVAMLEPEDKRLHQNIVLEPESLRTMMPKIGQVIVAQIERYPENHRPALAKIVEILGDYADSGMEIEIAVRKHHLPHQFSASCLKVAEKIPDVVQEREKKNRVDLRDLPLVTIDGEDSRDFDDAVWAEKVGRNYRLLVAIADVSHYVAPHSAIDEDAMERATSVYFPRRVIPMLPEKLSNGICSLNPDVERLCMVCDMVITYAGNIKSYQFYPAVMKSRARLTYTQVAKWLENPSEEAYSGSLNTLYRLYQILAKKRQQRGAMDFETVETKMLFNEQGKIERIIPVVRNDAHKLIEECMLAANVCAADFLLKNKHPTLFRNHSGPNTERLATLREQLGRLGLKLEGGDAPTPKDYALLLQQVSERADREIIQVMLLRSMQAAVYAPENEGHFGLAYEHYTHFTSPIRRYPDLLVHRAIKAALNQKTYHTNWQALGVHSSSCERRADDASRDVEKWLKTYYMRDKVGELFTGKVSHLTNFGVFVTLNDLHIEGMIHISDLGEDYFNYQPELLAMVGERSGVVYRIGDEITVKVVRADLETSNIDFVLVSSPNRQNRSGSLKKQIPQTKTHHQTTAQSKAKKVSSKIKADTPNEIKTASGKVWSVNTQAKNTKTSVKKAVRKRKK